MSALFAHTPTMLVNRIEATISLLKKVPEFIEEKGLTEESIIEARLAPDMLPFKKQITIMSDNAKGCIARLGGIENPSFPDTEATIVELIARLEKTIEFIKTHSVPTDEETLNRKVTLPFLPGKFLTTTDYVIEYLIPNFHFHSVIAYAILRNLGMKLGKSDYLGELTLQDL